MAAPSSVQNRPPVEKCAVFRRLNTLRQELKQSGSESDRSNDLSDGEIHAPGKMMSMSTMSGQNKMFTPARKNPKKLATKGERKSLQILQPGAGKQSVLVGSNGLVRLCNDENTVRKGKRKMGECDNQPNKQAKTDKTNKTKNSKAGSAPIIYEDPKVKSQEEKKSKSLAEEALELMVNEPVPESYWKELAEERRKALEDALKENEELHHSVQELKCEVERLSELAGQTEYFAGLIRELMNDKEDDERSEEAKEDNEDPESTTTNSSSSESDSDSNIPPFQLDTEEESSPGENETDS